MSKVVSRNACPDSFTAPGRRDRGAGQRGFRRDLADPYRHLFRLSDDLPLVVLIVDAEKRIREFLPQLDELEINGLVILDDVEVVRYVAGERPRRTLRRARQSSRGLSALR